MRQSSFFRLPDILALVGILATLLLTATQWPFLPRIIPIHFDLHGNVNGYGSRNWLFVPGVLSAVLCGGILGLSRTPRLYNLPATPGSADRPRQEALAAKMIAWLAAVLSWIFFFLAIAEVLSARGQMRTLILWLIPCTLLAPAVPIGWVSAAHVWFPVGHSALGFRLRYTEGRKGACDHDGTHGFLHEI